MEHGLPWWIPVLLSVLVLAGTSELRFVTIIAAGASPWLAAAAGMLVNARHLPFGFRAAPLLGYGARALAAAHLVIDESISFALAEEDDATRRPGLLDERDRGGGYLTDQYRAGHLVGSLPG